MGTAQHFHVLAVMALADSKLVPEEKDLLLRCAEWLGLSRQEAGWILSQVARGRGLQHAVLPSDPAIQERLFHGLVNVAIADGVVSPEEVRCLQELGPSFGIEVGRVLAVLKRAQAVTLPSDRIWPEGWSTERARTRGPRAGDPVLRVGSTVAGKFELRQLLGVGGFGRVFRASHVELKEDVALKVLNLRIDGDAQAERRFRREVKTTRSFLHRYAVPLREFGRDPVTNSLYFTMDLVEGLSLDSVLDREGPLEPARAIALSVQTLEALGEAHRQGLVHRDLKPGNMLVTQGVAGEEEVRLVDFGIAKAIHAAESGEDVPDENSLVGTLAYMSPEQAQCLPLDARSDLYSMGVVLYELLSGHHPIEPEEGAADVRHSFLCRIVSHPPEPLSAEVPSPLREVVSTALSKDCDERFQSAAQFGEALTRAAQPGASQRFSRWLSRLRGQ